MPPCWKVAASTRPIAGPWTKKTGRSVSHHTESVQLPSVRCNIGQYSPIDVSLICSDAFINYGYERCLLCRLVATAVRYGCRNGIGHQREPTGTDGNRWGPMERIGNVHARHTIILLDSTRSIPVYLVAPIRFVLNIESILDGTVDSLFVRSFV